MTTATEAIAEFYHQEGLPEGGSSGYVDWVSGFGIKVPIFNTQARMSVLPYHDLHHIITGYQTDEAGEGEIAAWTLGTGGGDLFGQIYDLGAFSIGMARFPRRTIAAFMRGRQCRNLYHQPAATWLAMDKEPMMQFAGTDRPVRSATAMDKVALVRTVVEAAVVWVSPIAALAIAGTLAADLLRPKAA